MSDNEMLVMVDKDVLRQLRDNHNEMVETCRGNPTGASVWLMIGSMASLLDMLLGMLIGNDEKVGTLTIAVDRVVPRTSAEELEANLRRLGWTEGQLTPDLRTALSEIADNLNADRPPEMQ